MSSKLTNIIHSIGVTTHILPEELQLDFIGDVHGYVEELIELLEKLGYANRKGIWQHPTHKAVFVGDFINRGPFNRKVIELIKAMTTNGTGFAILGNHEINAICYFTRRKNGKPIRMPGPANKKLLDKIKREYADEPSQLKEDVIWLRKLPLFIDFGPVRVVHAYWNNQYIQLLTGATAGEKLKKSFLKEMMKGGTLISKAFMQTTKGIEFVFPPNMIVKDLEKVRRINFRVKWWEDPKGKTFNQMSYGNKFRLPDIEVPHHLVLPFDIYQSDQPPVFIGHYCVNDEPMIPAPNICCVDSCLANGGKLAAYRWQGEKHLTEKHLVFVDCKSKVKTIE
jgi:hypothetical protein